MPRTAALLAALLVAGCTNQPAGPPAPAVTARGSADHHDHDHDRGHRMLADAGPYHAALTAHLAKAGNELDVFFETAGKDQKPVPLPLAGFTATATRAADGKTFELTFEPAPADERPKGEPPGECSHFVAKAPWMGPDDELTVTADVPIKNRVRTVKWEKFVPRKYAHHVE